MFAGVAVQRMQQRILKQNVRAFHAVQEHVQPADRPRGSVVDLAAETEIGGVAAGLLDELAADDEHTARTASGVIHAHARRGLEDSDHEADDVARRVEVAALFARRFGEHVNEKFVGGTEQVGKLEILIAQPVAAKMSPHQVFAAVVRNQPLCPLRFQKADVVEDVFERFVSLAQRAKRGVEHAAIDRRAVV